MMEISGSGGAGNAALLQQWRERLFARADKDADGKLSLEEVRSLRPAETAGGGAGAPAGSAGNPANSAPGDAAGFQSGTLARATTEQVFGLLDTDADGGITATELFRGSLNQPPPPEVQPAAAGSLSDQMLGVLFGAQEAGSAETDVAARLAAMLERALKAYQPDQVAARGSESA